MSQAGWIEYLRTLERLEPPRRQRWWASAWLTDGDAWVTLAVALALVALTAHAIDDARWADGIPSVIGMALAAALAGFALARARIPGAAGWLIVLVSGAVADLLLTESYAGLPHGWGGVRPVLHRIGDWIHVARTGGITTDNLPFVAFALALVWICAFLTMWGCLRSRNPLLAVLPCTGLIVANTIYLDAGPSTNLALFGMLALLLASRGAFHRRVGRWRRVDASVPPTAGLHPLQPLLLVGAAILFLAWVLPRADQSPALNAAWRSATSPLGGLSDDVTRLFSNIDAHREVPLHNLGPSLPLQGRVKLVNKPLAAVKVLSGATNGRPLRATVYDEYTGQGWKQGPRSRGPLSGTQVNGESTMPAALLDRRAITLQVTAAQETNVMLTTGTPVAAEPPARVSYLPGSSPLDVVTVEPRGRIAAGQTYTVQGAVSAAAADQLRAAGSDYPAWVRDRYLQLPASLPFRVRQLAAFVTRADANPYDIAVAIQDYLRTLPVAYDIPPVPPGHDAVDWLLFDEKRGYSDYLATAMVMLLRSQGIPARLAVGFRLPLMTRASSPFTVTQLDSLAWPEAYFPGYGWIEFAPSQDQPLVAIAQTSGGTPGDAPIDHGETERNLPPDLSSIYGGSALGPDAIPPEGALGSTPRPAPRPPYGAFAGSLAGALALAVLAFAAWYYLHGLRGQPLAVRLWERCARLAAAARMGPRRSETPREFARRLEATLDVGDAPRRLAEAYIGVRYGARPPGEAAETAGRAWRRLRGALLARIVRRKDVRGRVV